MLINAATTHPTTGIAAKTAVDIPVTAAVAAAPAIATAALAAAETTEVMVLIVPIILFSVDNSSQSAIIPYTPYAAPITDVIAPKFEMAEPALDVSIEARLPSIAPVLIAVELLKSGVITCEPIEFIVSLNEDELNPVTSDSETPLATSLPNESILDVNDGELRPDVRLDASEPTTESNPSTTTSDSGSKISVTEPSKSLKPVNVDCNPAGKASNKVSPKLENKSPNRSFARSIPPASVMTLICISMF